MDYQGFLDAVQSLNENSYFYGNEVLYRMAAESDLTDKNQLAGMMWLIGRSYAASPQRRSYGVDEHKVAKWPVRSDNDGRDQFFSSIANNIQDLWSLAPSKTFAFDNSEKDWNLLKDSINFVLQFNLALSKAIEAFDYAPEEAVCTNHISFCSKFLHFRYPHSIFIIDSYAQAGANCLFSKYKKGKLGYICDPDCEDTYQPLVVRANPEKYCFEPKVYKTFFEKLKQLCDDPKLPEWITKETKDSYEFRRLENAENYASHCVYSYVLSCLLMEEDIKPSPALAGKDFCSMPRLVDTIFLNIKGKLTKAELEHYKELADQYGEHCKEYWQYRELLKDF